MSDLPRPQESEYAESYACYIELVPDGEILETLRDQLGETLEILQGGPEERETYRYAEGKWSLREVVGHMLDTERLFAFRALAMARSDAADLPGIDPDEWADNSRAGDRPLDDLAAEWAALRRANIHLFASMDRAAGERTGVAGGNSFTVRTFPWIIAGHELWHRQLIARDYLGSEA